MIMAGQDRKSLVIDDDFQWGLKRHPAGDVDRQGSMVMHWGMSEKLGTCCTGIPEYVFLGRDMMRSKDYSDETAELIDAEVKRFVEGWLQHSKAPD